jgi:hypothetical protein
MATLTAPNTIETAVRRFTEIQADEIARDLALIDALEAFVQSLPARTAGASPSPQEFREMAYEDREAGL